jgi:peptidoglycan/LPS O-acetylase OafA/YrhL
MNWSLLAALRFFLAAIVAFAHTVQFGVHGTIVDAICSLDAKAAVIGFLLVSGFSIAASIERDQNHFYFRRFKRIYPLYFLAVVAAIMLEYWLGEYQVPENIFVPLGALTAIGNLLLLQTFLVKPLVFNAVLWSLAVEVSYYLVTPVLRRLTTSALLFLVVLSGAIFVLPHHTDWGLAYTYALKLNALKYFWPFGMGFLLYFHRTSPPLFIAFAIVGAILMRFSYITPGSLAALPFLISLYVMYASTARAGHSKILDYLGDVSYPLYVFQLPIFVLCYATLGIANNYALFCAAVIIAIIAFELIDKRAKNAIFSVRYSLILATMKERLARPLRLIAPPHRPR